MMMLVMPSGAEEKPGRLSQPSLIVTPAGNVAFSGPRGGPFSPARFAFQVSSTAGAVSYSIRSAILAYGQFQFWHHRHSRRHNHSDRERQRVTSFSGRIWTCRRVHERIKR